MWDKNQKTIGSETNFSGIGLHSGGVNVTLVLPTQTQVLLKEGFRKK